VNKGTFLSFSPQPFVREEAVKHDHLVQKLRDRPYTLPHLEPSVMDDHQLCSIPLIPLLPELLLRRIPLSGLRDLDLLQLKLPHEPEEPTFLLRRKHSSAGRAARGDLDSVRAEGFVKLELGEGVLGVE
jgi:hypothetical protein